MIVVDSSVWIGHLRNQTALPSVQRLRAAFGREPIVVGDLVLLEVLQGAPDEAHAGTIERSMRQFIIAPMLDSDAAVRAARNYRLLRQRGITIRKTIDVIIGTFCLDRGLPLLHDDRDFDPMERYLGLATVKLA